MSEQIHQHIMHDVVLELLDMSKDKSIWEKTEFARGQLSALHRVLMMVQHEADVFGIDKTTVGLANFDVAAWFQEGPDYWRDRT